MHFYFPWKSCMQILVSMFMSGEYQFLTVIRIMTSSNEISFSEYLTEQGRIPLVPAAHYPSPPPQTVIQGRLGGFKPEKMGSIKISLSGPDKGSQLLQEVDLLCCMTGLANQGCLHQLYFSAITLTFTLGDSVCSLLAETSICNFLRAEELGQGEGGGH